MKQPAFVLLVISSCWLGILEAKCQTATVTEITKHSQGYTYENSSGFSISNNGTLAYDAPLNQLTGSPCCISATLLVDGQSILVTPSTYESDTGLKANLQGGNTLNHDLVYSQIIPKPGPSKISLQYDVVVGGVTRVGASSSYTLQEKVDGQSLSIFPKLQPSVFP